jgi:hypothetical protein
MSNTNRYLQAFKEQGNVIGLTSAVALSAALLNPLPLLVGLVAEAAYLIFIPDSKWYAARLSTRFDAEVEVRRQQVKQQVMPLLAPAMRERFLRLELCRGAIGRQPVDRSVPGGDRWFREVLRKLDFLLEKFLNFARREAEFRRHLETLLEEARGLTPTFPRVLTTSTEASRKRARNRPGTPPRREVDIPLHEAPRAAGSRWIEETVAEIQAHYQQEIEEIQETAAGDQDPNTQAVLEKRLDVLRRRQEGIGKIGKILRNLNHQLELLEDTFGLINDEIRARSPEQVLSEIEDVVGQTESMTQLLEEIAPFEQMAARLSG